MPAFAAEDEARQAIWKCCAIKFTRIKGYCCKNVVDRQGAKTFWPIYETYQTDLHKINERLVTIVNDCLAYREGAIGQNGKKLIAKLVISDWRIQLETALYTQAQRRSPRVRCYRYLQIENKIRQSYATGLHTQFLAMELRMVGIENMRQPPDFWNIQGTGRREMISKSINSCAAGRARQPHVAQQLIYPAKVSQQSNRRMKQILWVKGRQVRSAQSTAPPPPKHRVSRRGRTRGAAGGAAVGAIWRRWKGVPRLAQGAMAAAAGTKQEDIKTPGTTAAAAQQQQQYQRVCSMLKGGVTR
jgi:hypothetical protein